MDPGSCRRFVSKTKQKKGIFRKELYVWSELARIRMNSILLSQSFLIS